MSNFVKNNNLGDSTSNVIIDSELKMPKKKRRLTNAYKLEILEKISNLKNSKSIAELLRTEGLYTSCIYRWKKQKRSGELNRDISRGRRVKSPEQITQDALLSENLSLKKQLAQANAILELQKKVSEIFGISLKNNPENLERN